MLFSSEKITFKNAIFDHPYFRSLDLQLKYLWISLFCRK